MAVFVASLLYSLPEGPIRDFNPDVVIASSTYTWDNWPAAYHAKKHQARYVYELHDLWPLSPMELGGLSAKHPFIWTLQRAEDFACRTADKVVSLLPAAKEYLVKHGMPPERFVYVPNGVVAEEWMESEPVPPVHVDAIECFRQGKRCLVGYVGGHGYIQRARPIDRSGSRCAAQGHRHCLCWQRPEKDG
jgi:glycosyltransferase involved in cell wall biosynthesis